MDMINKSEDKINQTGKNGLSGFWWCDSRPTNGIGEKKLHSVNLESPEVTVIPDSTTESDNQSTVSDSDSDGPILYRDEDEDEDEDDEYTTSKESVADIEA